MMMMTLKSSVSWMSSSFFLNYQSQCYKQQFKPWKTVGISSFQNLQFQSVFFFFQFVHRCLILYSLRYLNVLRGYNFLGFSQFGDMSSQSLNGVFEFRWNLWHNSFTYTKHQTISSTDRFHVAVRPFKDHRWRQSVKKWLCHWGSHHTLTSICNL